MATANSGKRKIKLSEWRGPALQICGTSPMGKEDPQALQNGAVRIAARYEDAAIWLLE